MTLLYFRFFKSEVLFFERYKVKEFMKTDTIAAIATAVNNGGISIIRVSGDEAVEIVDKVYRSRKGSKKLADVKSHTINYGFIKDGDDTIDEVLVSVMLGPNSYTKEDVVEVNCHGGILVTKKILELIVKAGARIAEPGEFTKRAFLNGRIDLSQAEAVMELINAKSEYAVKSSVSQLKGSIHKKITEMRSVLIRDIAYIEAVLDDPEHYEFGDFSTELEQRVQESINEIERLLRSANSGKFVKEGVQTAIIGRPNAGKSSLLNTLIGEEKAIVTDIEGTTRDIIEETIQLDGICLNIIDTAGIRSTDNIVEQIGVEKAKECVDRADLILYVVDSSRKLDQNDLEIIDLIRDKNAIVLLNKSDLSQEVSEEHIKSELDKPVFKISAKNDLGLEEFKDCVRDMFFQGQVMFNDQIYITNIRHKDALEQAKKSLKQVLDSMNMGMPEDFLSIDLMSAYEVLGEIIGESVGEDLVNTIFAEFCMGK